jgi:Peptidase propeptide and YPEB domain
VAAVGVLLLAALLVSRSCGASDRQVSQERAISIAREATPFEPDKVQIRLVQRGIPPRAVWAVSLYDVDEQENPTRVNVVLVDGRSGAIVDR